MNENADQESNETPLEKAVNNIPQTATANAPEGFDSKRLLGVLNDAGYKTVEGADAVLAAIAAESDGSTGWLCSGYRVFPDGTKCEGCADCTPNDSSSATARANQTQPEKMQP